MVKGGGVFFCEGSQYITRSPPILFSLLSSLHFYPSASNLHSSCLCSSSPPAEKMGIIHTTIIIEELLPARRFYHVPAQPPAPAPAPALVMMSRASTPKKKILGLRYTDTGAVVPLLDAKGAYVPADAKVMVWIPGMNMWVAGPCVE